MTVNEVYCLQFIGFSKKFYGVVMQSNCMEYNAPLDNDSFSPIIKLVETGSKILRACTFKKSSFAQRCMVKADYIYEACLLYGLMTSLKIYS